MKKMIFYIWDAEYCELSDLVPCNVGRAGCVHSLVFGYNLDNAFQLAFGRDPGPEQVGFHTREFLEYLFHWTASKGRDEEFGIEEDCPGFAGLGGYARKLANGALTSARCITEHAGSSVIHWDGGRHHAQRARAKGFCYLNDPVITILELRKKFNRVVYIDLDLHHGDGVENAFVYSDRVTTVSFHRYERGFFPNSGATESLGKGRGRYNVFNVGLKAGLEGQKLRRLFDGVAMQVIERVCPEVIVLQCGVDGLSSDPCRQWNLSMYDYGYCVGRCRDLGIPTVYLGGGGYDNTSVARCYAYLTSVITEQSIDDEIPEHVNQDLYAPGYSLRMPTGLRKDENTDAEIEAIVSSMQARLERE